MPHVLARPKQLDVPVAEGPPPPFKAEPRHLRGYRGVLDVHPCWLLGALAVSDDLAPATVGLKPVELYLNEEPGK